VAKLQCLANAIYDYANSDKLVTSCRQQWPFHGGNV
jgi:hypothetical protein